MADLIPKLPEDLEGEWGAIPIPEGWDADKLVAEYCLSEFVIRETNQFGVLHIFLTRNGKNIYTKHVSSGIWVYPKTRSQMNAHSSYIESHLPPSWPRGEYNGAKDYTPTEDE